MIWPQRSHSIGSDLYNVLDETTPPSLIANASAAVRCGSSLRWLVCWTNIPNIEISFSIRLPVGLLLRIYLSSFSDAGDPTYRGMWLAVPPSRLEDTSVMGQFGMVPIVSVLWRFQCTSELDAYLRFLWSQSRSKVMPDCIKPRTIVPVLVFQIARRTPGGWLGWTHGFYPC